MFPVQFRNGKGKNPLRTAWTAALCEDRLKKSDWASTNISSTVDRIKDHNRELPLRLLANLLLGVVKVYSKKVVYLFQDCMTLESSYKAVTRQAERTSITLPSVTNFTLDDVDDPCLDTNDVYAHTADPSTINLEDYFFTVQTWNDERFDPDLGSSDPFTLFPGRRNLDFNDEQPLPDSLEKLVEEVDLNNEQPPPEESVDVEDSNNEQPELDLFEDPGEGVDLNIEQQGHQQARKRNYYDHRTVLSNKVMKKNLNDASKLRRTRRNISSLIHKRVLTGDLFHQPIFEGVCKQLQELFAPKNRVGATPNIVEEGHEIHDDFHDALVDANDVPANSATFEKYCANNYLEFLFLESDSIPAGRKYSMRTRALVKYFQDHLPQPHFTLRQSLFNETVQVAIRMLVEVLVALNANLIGAVDTEGKPGQFYDVQLKLIPPEENGEGDNEGRGNEEEEKGGFSRRFCLKNV